VVTATLLESKTEKAIIIPRIDVATSITSVINTIPGVRIFEALDGRRNFIVSARRGSGYRSAFTIFPVSELFFRFFVDLLLSLLTPATSTPNTHKLRIKKKKIFPAGSLLVSGREQLLL
jgi:hypothetical protein